MLAQSMAVRKREDAVFPNTGAIDLGASGDRVAMPRHLADDPVREFGDLNAIADWRIACAVDTVAPASTGVCWIPVDEASTG
jgi:hypothetical protein